MRSRSININVNMFISYRFEEYMTTKSIAKDPQQPLITAFSSAQATQYNAAHPQQKAITNSILADLVIGCNIPLSIVENRFFRIFCQWSMANIVQYAVEHLLPKWIPLLRKHACG